MNIWRFHTWDVTGTKNVREKCNWVHKRDLELEILCVWVTERKREIERVKEMPPFLSSKWISKWQELWTVIDGIPGWPKKKKEEGNSLQSSRKFTETHRASCPGRCQPAEKTPLWYLSNCDDITSSLHSRGQQMVCVICYLPRVLSKTSSASQKMLWWKMNRWTHESRNKSEGGFFQMSPWQRHLPGRMRLFYLWLHICECTNKWDLFSKRHLRVTIINIGRLWFYAEFQIKISEVSVVRMHDTQGHVIRMCASQNPLK